MTDKSAWIRAITGASERAASALGLKKSKPVASATFQDLTPDEKSNAVRRTLKLSNPDDKAASIAAMARELGNMERPKDRSSVIDEAIKNFGAEGGAMAASAIVSARDHLQPRHQSKLNKMVQDRPKLNKLINDEINDREDLKVLRTFNEDALRDNERKARADLMNSRSRDDRVR